MAVTTPYGAWRSPIDAGLAVAGDGHPQHVGAVGDEVWWTEARPAEDGRRTLVRRGTDGTERSVLPAPWNVRSRVLEYGGRPWAAVPRATGGPLIVFVHFADQRLYAWEPDAPGGAAPRPLTPVSAVGAGLRWVDPEPRPERGVVWCVLEEHTGEHPSDVRRVAAAVPLDGSAAEDRSAVVELTADASAPGGHRFLTGPRLSPDGRHAVWIAWDHPRMPWDGTELKLAEVTPDGRFTGVRTLMGGARESIAQAEWAADGGLLAATDRDGWWNVHRVSLDDGRAVNLCPRQEEFAGPLWTVGSRWFAPLPSGLIAVVHGRGTTRLGILDPRSGELVDVPGPWTDWESSLAVQDSRVVGIAAGPRSSPEVVELDTRTGYARVIGAAHRDRVDPAYYPESRQRTFTGPGGREVHAHVHPPRNPGHRAPDGERPPWAVWVHGGPTGRATPALDLEVAYFTSRGIGVVEVDYSGSTGYGREYRERLREQWGIADVEDCAAVARALVEEGAADPARLAVRGGSAGGWTTALSLATTDLYACGTMRYPVLDLTTWVAGGTHDFEAHYTDTLIGPFSEVPERCRDRSPLRHVDRLTAPFLLLQGLDDAICPPEQCERFLAALAGRGVPHAYLAFEGEGHGFRRADTLVRALEAELALYAEVFGFPGSEVPGLELEK
ncbi:prolyl oligopeptidase family serine peptidase [Streptomyces sp. URMC 123]|uniref:S9 family peptidase n=1 Tax=Streptomyces sp. URMC 123 TaxID=3423403 RepID=UPI003F1A8006